MQNIIGVWEQLINLRLGACPGQRFLPIKLLVQRRKKSAEVKVRATERSFNIFHHRHGECELAGKKDGWASGLGYRSVGNLCINKTQLLGIRPDAALTLPSYDTLEGWIDNWGFHMSLITVYVDDTIKCLLKLFYYCYYYSVLEKKCHNIKIRNNVF